MIEIPEAVVLSKQIEDYLMGKKVVEVIANLSPHKFAWFEGSPEGYPGLLEGRTIDRAFSTGGFVEVALDGVKLIFSEGVRLKYLAKDEKVPKKHQLMIQFEDESRLVASVQMYGGLLCTASELNNAYYLGAKTKPSPLDEVFDIKYFEEVILADELLNKSIKAVLATEQRIPGLGNGVLQDILFNSGLHHKRKAGTLSENEVTCLYESIKSTLSDMVSSGGRNTEKDLLGNNGQYETKMSKMTVGKPCKVCGEVILKKAYMGGSIYYCPKCQPE